MRFGLIIVLAASAPVSAMAANAQLNLDVLLVNDPDLPPVNPVHASWILAEAKATLADKLGFGGLTFKVTGKTTVAEFIERNTPKDDTCLKQFDPNRVRPKGRRPKDIAPSAVKQFLKRWKLKELRAFFPEDRRAGLKSYDDIVAALMTEFDHKLDLLTGFKLSNGKSLLAPERLDERSYVRWICAVRNQNEADLILTNGFILYDLGSEPYPHSIFAKNKVGGASLRSPKRTAIRGRAVVASTFSMVTDIPFFREEGVETLTAGERLSVIGTFIVAHELGHAVFKLPDFYDHPKECLMTTKFETGYVSGYKALKQYPGGCSSCTPYVETRSLVFEAQSARAQGDHKRAIKLLRQAIRKTPKHIDGSYLRYIADLSVDVAENFAEQNNSKQANRWLKSAMRIAKNHERALALRKKLRR